MKQHLQAIVTVLSLVNPLICGAMFTQSEIGQDRVTQLPDATKIALAVLLILTLVALAGARVLQIFGVSLQAFSVAGGGVLIWIGSSMLRGNTVQEPASRDGATETRSLTPVILFAASPGTITGVITLAVAHTKLALPITALVAVMIAVAVLWILMVLMARGGSRPRRGFSARYNNAIYGTDCHCNGCAVRVDGHARVFHYASLSMRQRRSECREADLTEQRQWQA